MTRPYSRYAAACTAAVFALSGCANFQITVPDSDPVRVKDQATEYQKKTMHAFFWGLVLDPQVLAAECHGQGINDVVIDRTVAHDLAGVITLGLWMPTDVGFRCKAPPTRSGVLPMPPKRPDYRMRQFSLRPERLFFDKVCNDLDAASIPFTLHWGKYNTFLTPDRVPTNMARPLMRGWPAAKYCWKIQQ